ncbi:MAG: hypothetical protein B7733_01955 [Myxococcales bacterium FL481]|nr:MAG: hypothetical protein B7733_01955 [Myxococcales bacterium FL481]
MSHRILVLDLGGVIVDVDFSRFGRMLAEKCDKTPEAIAARWSQGPEKDELDRGKLTPVAFCDAVVGWCEPGPIRREDVFGAWSDVFAVKPEAAAFLAQLPPCEGELDYSLWCYSDTDPMHTAALFSRLAPLRRFDERLLSWQNGKLKRDPGAFEPLVELRNVGSPVLFVDDRQENVDAAHRAGVRAELFTDWPDLTPRLVDFLHHGHAASEP